MECDGRWTRGGRFHRHRRCWGGVARGHHSPVLISCTKKKKGIPRNGQAGSASSKGKKVLWPFSFGSTKKERERARGCCSTGANGGSLFKKKRGGGESSSSSSSSTSRRRRRRLWKKQKLYLTTRRLSCLRRPWRLRSGGRRGRRWLRTCRRRWWWYPG